MEREQKQNEFGIKESIVISAFIFAAAWIFTTEIPSQKNTTEALPLPNVSNPVELLEETMPPQDNVISLEDTVLPPEGVVIPVVWGDLGIQMARAGVIDAERFEALYEGRGGLSDETKALLYGENNGAIKITAKNSGEVLNLLWALGLGNKNDILDNGPMMDPRYGGAGRFASTCGWTVARGDSMEHYSQHQFVALTADQQALVERVSKNIYRPCCNNPTYFPDCNHGMAMLGLLELMASQGVGEKEMYTAALQVNAYWFPDTYLTIAQYLTSKGIEWKNADPKELLGAKYSSGSGYQQILLQVTEPAQKSGGGCGV